MAKEKVQPYRPLELMNDPKITNFSCDDFIGVWENFVPESFCDQCITWFDHVVDKGSSTITQEDFDELDDYFKMNDSSIGENIMVGSQQYGSNIIRKDISVLCNYSNTGMTYQINQFLKSCLMHYVATFGQLKGLPMISSDIKMQKTPPQGGYHHWHYENSAASHSQRELVWMIYLNDLEPEQGGETEFMYQCRRIRPTKGTVVFFPAGMTHVHKGNLVLSGDKYILTGWYIKTHLV